MRQKAIRVRFGQPRSFVFGLRKAQLTGNLNGSVGELPPVGDKL